MPWRSGRTTRAGIAGPVVLGVSGIGLLLAAVFPLRADASGATFDPGGHAVAGVMFFLTSAVGLILVSRRADKDPRWQSIARYTLVAGIVAVAGFVLTGALVIPDDAPLHDLAGLVQRALIMLVVFPARIVLSARLLRVTRAAAKDSGPDGLASS